MRLDKFLSDMGVDSRSGIRKKAGWGRIKVNGKVVRDPGFAVPEGAEVVCDKVTVVYEAFSYYMLNKPAGVISATEDKRSQTVLDLITETKRKDLFPVGRLDKDTEGLLLITNDGDLSHRLLSPKRHVDKLYFARIKGTVNEDHVKAFADGLKVSDDLTCLPAKLEILSAEDISEVHVTIREGKFHQIKRMFEALGMEVIYLKRLSMGSLILDPDLSPGSYRRLTEEELTALNALTGRI